MKKNIILLTACINPSGMPFTKLASPNERMKQYIDALYFYVHNTPYPIVFVENTGTDISKIIESKIKSKRLEILSFKGNENKNRGKGYGEAEIIDYAINNSRLICRDSCIIKITGRLIVCNLNVLVRIRSVIFMSRSIQTTINSKLSFADSRIIIAPTEFYRLFLKHKEKINDSNNIFFEHVLTETMKLQSSFNYIPFMVEPQFIGSSGTTGEKYKITKRNFNQQMVYLNYALDLYVKFQKESACQRFILPYVIFFACRFLVKLYCKCLNM